MSIDCGNSFLQSMDSVIATIAEYVNSFEGYCEESIDTARICLMDALGCGILALQFPECTKLLGAIVEGTIVPNGVQVPGTNYILDPIKAAFDIGTIIRWLDYNDTWLSKEWGHPSDNIGGLLAIADYLTKCGTIVTTKDLLNAMVKAYEIQGCLSMHNSFNQIGLDHVILVKFATAAVATKLLGGDNIAIGNALSQAMVDIGPLRTYRHAPNTGSRKSWAAGDQTSRGLSFALSTMKGEMGYPQVLTAEKWGFYDVLFDGIPLTLPENLGYYVINHILFKVSFPAEFHSQTAAECAFTLHPQVINRLDQIKEIKIETHLSAIKIIDKTGPLHNPADRDHCLQYIVALGLLYGNIKAEYYEDHVAADVRIDELRKKMSVVECAQYTVDYHDPEKRSVANAVTMIYTDTTSERIEVEYPLGHRVRRPQAIPLIFDKKNNMRTKFSPERTAKVIELFRDRATFDSLTVSELLEYFKPE
jgi:2-methylcitrate dehydratase